MPDPTEPADALADLGYADAVDELEEILAELDGDEVDVDRLAERVRRAADLVQLCRRRLQDAQVEVTRIVADLEAVAPGAVPSPVDEASSLDTDDEDDDQDEPTGGEGLFATEG
jgi:exodeoxyribonuclease VII small subunit